MLNQFMLYVKGFLALFLLLKVLLYIVPESSFSHYISFFSGILLVLGMLYPVLHLLGMEEVLLEKVNQASWEEQLYEISLDTKEWEEESVLRYENLLEEMTVTETMEGR